MDSLDMISHGNFLIECFLAVITRMTNSQMHSRAVVPESIGSVESRRASLTWVLPFVAMALHVTLEATCAVNRNTLV